MKNTAKQKSPGAPTPKGAIGTGGSSGIGQAIAIALARAGYRVAIVGSTPQHLETTRSLLADCTPPNADASPRHLGLALDVRQEKDMQLMVDRTLDQFGQIDLLVASAGLGKKAGSGRVMPYATASLPLEEWRDVIDVNLTGVFLSNRAVLPTMQQQGAGHIVNICSSTTLQGLRGQPYAPAYCASKFGVVGLTESLAAEVAACGIRVQAIFPGPVCTPLVAETALLKLFRDRAIKPEHFARSVLGLIQQPPDTVIIHPHLLPFMGERSPHNTPTKQQIHKAAG